MESMIQEYHDHVLDFNYSHNPEHRSGRCTYYNANGKPCNYEHPGDGSGRQTTGVMMYPVRELREWTKPVDDAHKGGQP